MPALPPYITEAVWEQFSALLPEGRWSVRWQTRGGERKFDNGSILMCLVGKRGQ
jgi:hypothetical protein